ncbi:MAG: hypothetical protein RIT26_729 [Pseudomonadota bacterium]|jgi:hypothetical protein
MNPESELLLALRSGHGEPTRLSAWLDLFLQLAEPRITQLRSVLAEWLQRPTSVLPFQALRLADELADLCAEQPSPSLSTLSLALATALRRDSAQTPDPAQREAALKACDELLRQLHQHAAGVPVVTPPDILQKLGSQKLGSDPN